MACVSNIRNIPTTNTLEGSVTQIDINKEMESRSNKMDQFEKFFLDMEENESDLEDSTPTPEKKQCCDNPEMVDVGERKQMCQNCGMEVRQNIEDATTEVPKLVALH